MPRLRWHALMITGDAVADAVDTAELLGVEVDQFARPLALVAHHRRRGSSAEAAEPQPAQHRPHGRARQASSRAIAGCRSSAAGAVARSPSARGCAVGRAVSRGRRARSRRSISPPARYRFSHSIGTSLGQPGRRRSVRNPPACSQSVAPAGARPGGVRRAFLWTFIRDLAGLQLFGLATTASQPYPG